MIYVRLNCFTDKPQTIFKFSSGNAETFSLQGVNFNCVIISAEIDNCSNLFCKFYESPVAIKIILI